MAKVSNKCLIHPLFAADYICFDQKCKIEPKSCVLCIKNNHLTCNIKMVIDSKDIEERVQLHFSENQFFYNQKLNEKMELTLNNILTRSIIYLYENQSQIIQNSLKKLDIKNQKFSFENLKKNKKNFAITFDKETQKIVISNLHQTPIEPFDAYVLPFQTKIREFLNNYIQQVISIPVHKVNPINPDFFGLNEGVFIQQIDSSLLVSMEENPANDLPKYIWLKEPPLNKIFHFKINAKEGQHIRFEVGFANGKYVEVMKSGKAIKNQECMSFSEKHVHQFYEEIGIFNINLFEKTMLEFYLEVDNESKVKVYSLHDEISLLSKTSTNNGYLFIALFCKDTSIFLTEFK